MIKDNLFYSATQGEIVPNIFPDFLPEWNDSNKFLNYINKYATKYAGIGQPDVNLAYIKSLYHTILPLYHVCSTVNERVFTLLMLAADKIHKYVPSAERKTVLVPALKQVCMALSVAIKHCEDSEAMEVYETHIKKYLRILNTLGVNVNTEEFRIAIASFYREELVQLENPVLKNLFKQQAIHLLNPSSETIPHSNFS